MRPFASGLLLAVVLAVPAAGQEEPAVMPYLVGQDLWTASKVLRRMMLDVGYEQVEVDTESIPEFHVAGQAPDSGVVVDETKPVLDDVDTMPEMVV